MAGTLEEGWAKDLPTYTLKSKHEATRKYSQHALTEVVGSLPEVVGGSADLTPSNNTKVEGNKVDYSPATPEGRYVGPCSWVGARD